MPEPVFAARDLTHHRRRARLWPFSRDRQAFALDHVSLAVQPGTILALVGESGSGKSTLARLAAGLDRPDSGDVRLCGQPLSATRSQPALRRRLGIVFQDAAGTLDPLWPVGDIIAEPLRTHRLGSRPEQAARVTEVLLQVGLDPSDAARLPGSFSGGQRQRIAIARAIAGRPDFLICDEPTSALDMTVQARILNLFLDLCRGGTAMLVIGHDLPAMQSIADQVAVLHDGRLVEHGPAGAVFSHPRHPYTQALLGLVPSRAGVVDPAGCAYRPRCPIALPRCATDRPSLSPSGSAWLACHAVPHMVD